MSPHVPVSRGISLKVVIALTYIGLVVACASAIGFFTYRENSKLFLDIANSSFKQTGVSTIDNTNYLLQPVGAAVDAIAIQIDEDPSLLQRESLMKFLYEMTRLYPQIYSAYVAAAEDGGFVQVQRLDPASKTWGPDNFAVSVGSAFVLRTVEGAGPDRVDTYRYVSGADEEIARHIIRPGAYDPRVRPFYEAAMRRSDRVLTDSYVFASNGKLGLTIARRIERDGKPIGVVGADITLESLSRFLTEQPVGTHGLAIIVGDGGDVVAAPGAHATRSGDTTIRTIKDFARPELDEAWRTYHKDKNSSFIFNNGGQEFIAAFYPFPTSFDKAWTIMEVAPIDDFVGRLKATLGETEYLSIGIACLGALASLLIAGQITKPIEMVIREADRIRSLSFSGAIKNSSHITEIARLIDAMAAMKTAIRTLAGDDADQIDFETMMRNTDQRSPSAKLFKKVIAAVEDRRARETELSLATSIQHSVLPRGNDEDEGHPVQIAARMRAAKEVGGDFYDWVWRGDDKLAFVVGDVSGKGVPAALFMSSTRTAIRTMFMAGASIEEAVVGANRLLVENNDGCFFVTIFIAELDVASGKLTFINAGHEPARIRSTEGAIRSLDPSGPALGVIDEAIFPGGEIQLEPGDTLIVLTDGVTDAVNSEGVRFGEVKIDETLAEDAGTRPSNVVSTIFSTVDAFAGSEVQFDDITCLVLHYARAA